MSCGALSLACDRKEPALREGNAGVIQCRVLHKMCCYACGPPVTISCCSLASWSNLPASIGAVLPKLKYTLTWEQSGARLACTASHFRLHCMMCCTYAIAGGYRLCHASQRSVLLRIVTGPCRVDICIMHLVRICAGVACSMTL
jgi:hypothetical protein